LKTSLLDQGIKNFENENFTKAIKIFEKILKLDPDNPEAIINKTSCLAEIWKV
jgi:Flp pilus assembly protein TadD, contains TPR repeats